MTHAETAVTAPAPGAQPGKDQSTGAPQARPAAAAAPGKPARPASGGIIRGIGLALTLLAVAILGFVAYLYLLSGVQEARAQTGLYSRLQIELGGATAPLGSPSAGTPVAILSIPSIGLRNVVVVEGTSPENLTLGPGHLRNTPLPGQAGVSVVFGRRATFGGPFADLPSVQRGAQITVITGQGTARYKATMLTVSSHPVPFTSVPNQLLLLTADSRYLPGHYVELAATLTSTAQPDPGGRPSVTQDELPLGRDFNALILTLAWSLALALAAVAGSVAAGRWARWPAWLATVPVVLAIMWNLYQSLSALLPNLY
jgi:sortase A